MCTVSCACLAIDILRSIIHATPYIKIFLWLVRLRRFPSGVWFEIISCRSNAGPMDVGRCSDASTPSEKSWKRTDISGSRSSVSVSILQSNFLNIGKVLTHWATILSLFCHWCCSSSTTARHGHSWLMSTITPDSILVSSTMKPLDFELSKYLVGRCQLCSYVMCHWGWSVKMHKCMGKYVSTGAQFIHLPGLSSYICVFYL